MTSQIPVITGLLASIGAGLCCAGPFILVSIGVSGAWIANLTLLEPYRPLFIATVIAMFLWGGWAIYRPQEACVAGSSCAVPKIRMRRKILFWVAAVISASLVMSPYLIPLLVA
ncbi:mercuric transporter MerT family protein [Litoribacillus peritrichatus]|uniref:mercuric transporter MerT family protein n=1 Tax=Litoribacillus peritrichatus TaxID=718191 RepID=UPI0031DB6788